MGKGKEKKEKVDAPVEKKVDKKPAVSLDQLKVELEVVINKIASAGASEAVVGNLRKGLAYMA